jgi:hypothetical protein
VRTPTIHLNGDRQESLLEESVNALGALRDARAALCNITVNGRNFYPQGPDATNQALKDFRAMLGRFDLVVEEVERYADAVADGGAK